MSDGLGNDIRSLPFCARFWVERSKFQLFVMIEPLQVGVALRIWISFACLQQILIKLWQILMTLITSKDTVMPSHWDLKIQEINFIKIRTTKEPFA